MTKMTLRCIVVNSRQSGPSLCRHTSNPLNISTMGYYHREASASRAPGKQCITTVTNSSEHCNTIIKTSENGKQTLMKYASVSKKGPKAGLCDMRKHNF